MIDLVFKSLFSHFVLTVMMSFISSGFIYMILSFPYAHYNFDEDNLPVVSITGSIRLKNLCAGSASTGWLLQFEQRDQAPKYQSCGSTRLESLDLYLMAGWMSVEWMDVLDETWGDMMRRSHVSTQNILFYFSQCRAGQKNSVYGIRLGISTMKIYTPVFYTVTNPPWIPRTRPQHWRPRWIGTGGTAKTRLIRPQQQRKGTPRVFGNSIRWMSDMMLEVKFATFQQKFYLFWFSGSIVFC